ncbi:hypothetical protein HanIR_Chr10g0497481 [Helianthus annuus]|nr:hypothetical protein HanIR_Chr10g0497481 [Helianthus annuus]
MSLKVVVRSQCYSQRNISLRLESASCFRDTEHTNWNVADVVATLIVKLLANSIHPLLLAKIATQNRIRIHLSFCLNQSPISLDIYNNDGRPFAIVD